MAAAVIEETGASGMAAMGQVMKARDAPRRGPGRRARVAAEVRRRLARSALPRITTPRTPPQPCAAVAAGQRLPLATRRLRRPHCHPRCRCRCRRCPPPLPPPPVAAAPLWWGLGSLGETMPLPMREQRTGRGHRNETGRRAERGVQERTSARSGRGHRAVHEPAASDPVAGPGIATHREAVGSDAGLPTQTAPQQVWRVADEEGGDVLVRRPGLGRRRAADGVASRRPQAGQVALEDVVGGVGDLVDSTRWQSGDSTGSLAPLQWSRSW